VSVFVDLSWELFFSCGSLSIPALNFSGDLLEAEVVLFNPHEESTLTVSCIRNWFLFAERPELCRTLDMFFSIF